jgi:hypothetical protein
MVEKSKSRFAECPQCGAHITLPMERISTACAFCDIPLVESNAEKLEIHRVAPFNLNAKQAANRLRTELRSRWMAPEAVRKKGKPEDVEGVFLPFWAYDAVARSNYTVDIGIHWYETETYTTTDSEGRTVTRTRTVRRTDWHDCQGSHVGDYRDQLVSASRGLSEGHANQLEPFDLGLCQKYNDALIAGWPAERPSVADVRGEATARQEFAAREGQEIAVFLPGDEHRGLRWDTTVEMKEVELFLLPVWIARYKHKGQVFPLWVNGQTGEVVGDTPISIAKKAGLIGAGLIVAFAIWLFVGSYL